MKGILKNKMQHKLLTMITVVALVITSLTGQFSMSVAATEASKTAYTIPLTGSVNTVSNDVGPADTIADGAILHAWCWSFNTIKNNMKQIADAGYTSVQTSPAGACLVGNGGDKSMANWYWHYQPTDYTIGNYQLGSESEFAAMCKEAEKYGIKIIVDVVANHMTGNQSAISNNYKSISNWCHTTNEIKDWNSRYQVTQLALMGMPDNNTQNKQVQNYIRNYLLRCVELGADGFRFDAAKHIELPDDSGFGGDFWPTVLNNGSEFQYGETLQDSISRESAYANYMGVTASSYGMKLRTAVGSNNFSTGTLNSLDINAPVNKTVTWVESHDNYANALSDWGSSEWMNDEQIKLAWAVIAARKNGTPLFFSRPVGGGGQTWDNRFPGKSQIGDRGSDLFMDDEVAAVNRFRNAMEGQNEYLRNPNGDTKVLMVERGNKGVTIINSNYSEYDLSSTTNLANGTYTNQTDNNNVFHVSNGRITGKLPARSVVVLFDYDDNAPSVSIGNCPSSFRTDSITLKLSCKNTVKATYAINGGTSYLFNNDETISIGALAAYNTTFTIELRGINENGVTVSQTYTITKKDPNASTNIYFTKPSSWGNTVYAYVYNESGTTVEKNAAWPGATMSYDSSTGNYKISYQNDWASAKVIFSDGTNQVPGANQSGFDVVDNGVFSSNGFTGKTITPTVSPSPSITPTTTPVTGNKIYFTKPSGWSTTVYAYVYDESGSTVVTNAAWPGVAMSSETNGEYSYTLDSNVTANSKVIFTDGSNQVPASGQTGWNVTKNGHYDVNGLVAVAPSVTPSPSDTPGNTITIYYKTSWSTAYVHYKVGSGSWTTAPGVKMSSSSKSDYKEITISLGSSTNLTACFNNGSGTWDNNSSNNYYFASSGTYTVNNGVITKGSPS